ncbi:MAG: dihydroxyacetone kinase phosphoryl donor subunit DhaM [Bacillota bacterium]
MVGLVIVSHSIGIAEGIKELARQMTPEPVPIAIAAGTNDGRLGTNAEQVTLAINEVYSNEGIIILFDLGSALMSAELALECLPEEKQKNIMILDAAIVEGAITAVVEISLHKNLHEIKEALQDLCIGKIR